MSLINVVSLILIIIGVYLLVGLVFCVALLIIGLPDMDPSTRKSGFGFKLIIVPGILVFWPILWKKWKDSRS